MKTRRTKIQKAQARHVYEYRLSDAGETRVVAEAATNRLHTQVTLPLLLTPRSLIIADLWKILIFSGLMLLVEWMLYRYI